MSRNKKFGLALTTYNRADRLIPFLKKYDNYNLIDEIIVTDDCSNDYEFLIKENWSDKVIIHRNEVNLQAYQNKLKTIEKIKNNWCILFDSDNFFDENYLIAIQEEDILCGLDENIIYCPSAARPNFNYKHLCNIFIDKDFWNKNHIKEGCMLNTGNMLLSKKAITCLLNNFKKDLIKNVFVECKYMNYIFIKNGFRLKVLEKMEYIHSISHDSHYNTYKFYHENFDNNFNWILQ
jgi:glycosyltransferase involved in cell wall biosynthesis